MMNEKNDSPVAIGNGRKIKNDVILVASVLLFVLVMALLLFLLRTEGDSVSVTVDGREIGVYSLSEDRVVEIEVGDGYNVLVIENGVAYVREASCPDGICSSHRPISYGGESIICLPNKVVVEVHTTDASKPDIIN